MVSIRTTSRRTCLAISSILETESSL